MADIIQLTPAELLQQAAQMTTLQDQYTTMFGELEKILSTVNSSWSANLASNFLGKITSAKNVFARVLDMLDGGIRVATTAANSFASVDSELAKLFGEGSFLQSGSNFIQDTVSDINIDSQLLSFLSTGDMAKYYDALKSGDVSQITDILFKGFTDDAKGRITDLIKDKTGLTVDSSILEKAKNGDVSGALFDIAGASNSIFTANGGMNSTGLAIDFLLEVSKNSTDRNNWVAKATDEYVFKMQDNFENGNFKEGIGDLCGYLFDVAPRNIADAGGKVVYHAADGIVKTTTGHSLTEIDNKIGDTIGVKPSEVWHGITESISNIWSKGVKKAVGGTSSALKEVISSVDSCTGNLLRGVTNGLHDAVTKLF